MELPQRIEGAAAWYGADLRDRDDWIHRFTAAEIEEIDAAVEGVRSRGPSIAEIGRAEFPLPGLESVLGAIAREVVEGRGFVVLRGLPVAERGREWAATAYWGIGAYIGAPVPQNAKGHLLGHVRDIGLDPNNPEHRIYGTRARHRFHTDSCDVVGLLCLQPAKAGGESSVVSSVTAYNEMMAHRPDLARVLAEPFFVDRKGEIPVGKGPYYAMPVFNLLNGQLSTIYARDFIEGAQRFEDVPRLTQDQIDAMDMLDELTADRRLRLDMWLEAGDVQLLHNHQTLHARTAYEDYDDPERKRHLLRLWLAPPNGRPLPPIFAERYGDLTPGARGGIRVPGVTPTASLVPA